MTDDKKWESVEQSMAKYRQLIDEHNVILKNATIQEFLMWDDPEDFFDQPRMALLVLTKDKREFTIHVDQDPEGNGPGWLVLEEAP